MTLQVTPAALEAASHDLTNIGSMLTEANATMAPMTTAISPAAADEVSASIAALFGEHGVAWQELAALGQSFHQRFVQLLTQAANIYQEIEDANAESMRQPGFTLVGTPPNGVPVPNGYSLQPVGLGEDIFHIGWGGSVLP